MIKDNLTLSKAKREWRENEYKECECEELKNGQKFTGGRKILLIYSSNKDAKDGYRDAQWIKRIEIHHILGSKCHTYFDDKEHDAVQFNDSSYQHKDAPRVYSTRIQRDGATAIVIYDDFYYFDYQAAELRAL